VIKDDLGRTVRIVGTPQRVLSLAPSATEWMFALGAQDQLVARSDHCDAPAAAAQKPSVGSLFPPDLERMHLTRPDLVLMIDGAQAVRSRFEADGVPVLVLQPASLKALDAGVMQLADVLGRRPQAEALARKWQRTPKPSTGKKVIYLAGAKPAYAAGPKTFIADVIRHAGGEVIDLKLTGDWPQVPLEKLALARPDIIIASDKTVAEQMRTGGPAWQAMKAKIVAPPDPDWLARPGPRVDAGLQWLTSVLR
jgi:iron complex transport system substrate-binding protein